MGLITTAYIYSQRTVACMHFYPETLLIWTLSSVPFLSGLEGFHCTTLYKYSSLTPSVLPLLPSLLSLYPLLLVILSLPISLPTQTLSLVRWWTIWPSQFTSWPALVRGDRRDWWTLVRLVVIVAMFHPDCLMWFITAYVHKISKTASVYLKNYSLRYPLQLEDKMLYRFFSLPSLFCLVCVCVCVCSYQCWVWSWGRRSEAPGIPGIRRRDQFWVHDSTLHLGSSWSANTSSSYQ